jgi:hypothetical protein
MKIDTKKVFRNFIEFMRHYSIIWLIFSIITIFFIFTEPGAVLEKTSTLFSDNTIIKLAAEQHFIWGGLLGFIILIIYYYSTGAVLKYSLKYILGHVLTLVFFLIWATMLSEVLFITPVLDNIVKWSNIFMNADKTIFGVYPAFFMYKYHNVVFERIVVESYNYLNFLIAFWTLFLIATQRMDEFLLWSKRILLSLAICIPLWFIFPATQPSIMYITNIFDKPVPADLAADIKLGPPSLYINKAVNEYTTMWLDPFGKRFSTSNFPSMHVIWGFLLFLSVARVFKSKITKTLFFIFAVTNTIGTVYVLQHYAVDAVVGVAVVVLVWTITRRRGIEMSL